MEWPTAPHLASDDVGSDLRVTSDTCVNRQPPEGPVFTHRNNPRSARDLADHVGSAGEWLLHHMPQIACLVRDDG